MTSRADKYTGIQKEEIYSDFYTDFTPHPDTGDLVRLTNEKAVIRSVRNLVLTNKYERLFQPELGGNIRALLFENITPQTQATMKTYIQELIENYEPRAKLIAIDVAADEFNGGYQITILFYVINKSNPISVSIQLERIR